MSGASEQLELGFEAPRELARAATSRRRRPPLPGGRAVPAPHGPSRSAVEIAAALDRPPPTPEQAAVIEAPIEPLLVVAGAGSGKTETMAARVVWLVANGHVLPEEVLGLTFTRKAAGELAERIRARLRALHRRGLVPAASHAEPQPVTVSTYHAYAAGVLGDHALRLGVEPGARLIGEAGAWQLAAELVERWDGDMTGVDKAPTTVTEAVLALAGECAEHLVDPDDVDALITDLIERALALPAKPGQPVPGTPKAVVRERLALLDARRKLVPLVRGYLARKRELELLDFGDQVALAARLARDTPEVGAGERARYRVVLLDEYQDTSHAQLVMLRGLFGSGHPVTAVGDPHQSIYGWRGASAGNLQRFPTDFPVLTADRRREPADTRYLSTSWRNDAAVLDVANRLSADLRRPPSWTDSSQLVDVPALTPRPDAGPGSVRLAWLATVQDEARAVAELVEEQWRSADPPPSAAVLCRTRAQFPLVEAALRARGLPVEVVGLGGLLSQPEVVDLRAALEVLYDPTRGDSLIRLLTGPAWRIGPRDLEALGVWAGELVRGRRPRPSGPWASGPAGGAPEADPDPTDERSIVDALDALPPAGWQGPAGQQLSQTGHERLQRLGRVLRELRRRLTLPLPDLVLDVERALLLDVEVAARPGVRPGAARANLDAFADVAVGFAASSGADRPGGLGAFLSWLTAADSRERGLEAPLAEPRKDAVQVLTVHAAKGLEWDVVAVAGLVEGTFPAGRNGRPPAGSNGWLGELGALPYPLRGDAAGLPVFRSEAAGSQPELAAELEAFRERCGRHEVSEERRLGYVAVTRARRLLLLTGAVWGAGSTPREPSRFLLEAAELPGAVVTGWQQPPQPGSGNPLDADPALEPWPRDVLAATGRREAVEAGAALVAAALLEAAGAGPQPAAGVDPVVPPAAAPVVPPAAAPVVPPVVPPVADTWAQEVTLLLTERDTAVRRGPQVALPAHLSASRMVALAADPAALALRLRRPMPERPSPHARRGSAFHAWLERRFGAAALLDLDELPGAADEVPPDVDLESLQQHFLASEWADRVPEAVEVPVETPVGGVVLRGRIDAVFRRPAAGPDDPPGWDVVDWKTGPPPSGADRSAASVQLAVYRLAWARLTGTDVELVGAAFFYAATGRTVRPVDLLDHTSLAALLTSALTDPSTLTSALTDTSTFTATPP